MLKDLLSLAGRKKTKMLFSCILHVIACALAVVPFFVIYLIFLEIFVKSPDQRSVWVLLALIPFIYFGMSAILVSAYNISHVAAYEILADIRIELGKKLFRLPLGYFNERNTGELKTVMNENVELLEFFLAHHLPEMISTIFVPLFMAILLFLVDWKNGSDFCVPRGSCNPHNYGLG